MVKIAIADSFHREGFRVNGGKVKIATILKITIEIGTVLIALMALLFSIRPQLLPWNNNHFE